MVERAPIHTCALCGRIGVRDFKVIEPQLVTVDGQEVLLDEVVQCTHKVACWRRQYRQRRRRGEGED